MRTAELTLITFLIGSTFGLGLRILDTINEHVCNEPPTPTLKREPVHLPTKCAEFYNDDTEAWIDCMGVGYVYRRDL